MKDPHGAKVQQSVRKRKSIFNQRREKMNTTPKKL